VTLSDNKVQIAERTSAKGYAYLSGFLGKARIVGFRGEPRSDGTPTWNLYLTPGKEQGEGAQQPRPRPAPNTTPIRPSGVQRWCGPEQPAADNGQLFFDDPVDDLGRGEA
jgi:hypothetical protein